MAINFPDSPSTNDTHTVGDKTWTWNGTYWHLNQNSSTYYAQDGVPSDPDGGDFWFESDTGQLFVRYDSTWVEIGHATDFGSSMSDADGDTLIQLEEGSDEDIIRFDTGGTERMTIAANGAVNVGGTLTAGAFAGPLTGNVTGNTSGSSGSTTGNAATATALATARTIGGTSFDGTANIAVGLAATATALATGRTINGVSFDGTGNITVTAAAGTLSGSTLASGVTASSLTSVGALTALTVTGDLTVNGTTTTINSTTLTVDDKNIELGSVASPSDTTADGGGITLKGASDKTILWTNSTDAWHFNQGINVTAGNVGIGATTTIAKLDVRGQITAHGNAAVYEGVNVGVINIHGGVADTILDWGEGLVFTSGAGGSGNWTHAGIVGVGQTGFRGDLVFGTDGDGTQNTTGITEKMRITHDGNVGIGTTSPSRELSINGATNAYLSFDEGDTESWVVGYEGGSNNRFIIYGPATSRDYRMVILDNGNVGIGTTSPAHPLDVVGSSHTYIGILAGTNSSAGLRLRNDARDWDVNIRTDDKFSVYDQTASAARLTIDTSGNVGIGTTSPAAPLSFANATGQKIDFYHSTGGSGDRYGIQVQSSELRIHSGASGSGAGGITFGKSTTSTFTERMRITNDGNVGIGTTAPGDQLHVYEAGTGNAWRGRALFGGQDQVVVVGSYAGKAVVGAHNTALNAWGDLILNYAAGGGGNVGIGTTTPSAPLHVVGAIRSQEGGDGGFTLRGWTASSTYASLATNSMAGSEYVLLSDGTHTFISAGSGGDIYLRPAANTTASQVKLGTGGAEFSEYTLFSKNIRVLCNSETWSEGIRIIVPANAWGGLRFKRTNAATGETGNWAFGYENNSTHDLSFNSTNADNVLYLEYDNSFVGVKTDNPIAPLHVVGGNATSYGLLVEQAMSCRHVNGKSWNSNGINDGALYLNYDLNQNTLLCWNNSTGRVFANTSVLTGSTMVINSGQFGYSSSRAAIKDDIRDVTGGIDTLKALRPVRFRFKPEAIGDGTNDMVAFDERIGFVAEEMASVSHELATWEWLNDDGGVWLDNTDNGGDERPPLEEAVPIGWETDAVVSVTVAALQELIARVETLESA